MGKLSLNEDEINKQIDEVLSEFYRMQDDLISAICRRVEDISTKTPDEIEKLVKGTALTETLNDDIIYLKRRINTAGKIMTPKIVRILHSTKKSNFEFAKKYYDYRKIKVSDIENSRQVRDLVTGIQKQTLDNLLNISHTYSFRYDNQVTEVGKTYRKIVNRAVIEMQTGSTSIDKVMKDSVKQLVNSGITSVHWESGTVRRADSHIRMNIEEGVQRLNYELSEFNGKRYGADGVETSAHSLCAPDHQEFQGRQFLIRDWEKINNGLRRPFGTLNCRHYVSYIIMGVSVPVYFERERQEAIDRSNAIVKYNETEMTRYQASQKQRAYERDIRILRSLHKHYGEIGDTISVRKVKQRLNAKIRQYHDFSNAVGLSSRMDRTYYFI